MLGFTCMQLLQQQGLCYTAWLAPSHLEAGGFWPQRPRMPFRRCLPYLELQKHMVVFHHGVIVFAVPAPPGLCCSAVHACERPCGLWEAEVIP